MTDQELSPTVRIDVGSITLGEMDYVERLSGQPMSTLLATTGGRMMVALAIDDLRTWPGSENSSARRSWPEISALRLLDVSSSPSPSRPAGRQATSRS